MLVTSFGWTVGARASGYRRFAPGIVPPGELEQPFPRARVRPRHQIARTLREALVKLFHDATPATSLKAGFH